MSTVENQTNILTDRDLPALHTAADAASLRGQNYFLRATRLSLLLLVIAASAGAFTIKVDESTDLAGIVAVGAFALVLLARIYLLTSKPDRRWYEGRAAAESVKTLAWRYAVKGEPFISDLSDTDADSLLASRVHETLTDLPDIALERADSANQITPKMRSVRSLTLSERRTSYDVGRIADQYEWYSNKAVYHDNQAHALNILTLIAESAGLLGGILKATTILNVDVLGIAAAIAAGFTAWEQARQHRTQATAYGIAAQELATIRALIPNITTEAEWGAFVDEAEEAISREHQLWRASHGIRLKKASLRVTASRLPKEDR